MYTFTPPTVEEGPAGGHWLFYRYTLPRGLTTLKVDGQYYDVRDPSQDELAEAEVYYLGGHDYEVTLAQKEELEAAGYTVVTS